MLQQLAEFLRINAIRRVLRMLRVRRSELIILVTLTLIFALFEGFGIGLLLPVLQYAQSGASAVQESSGAVWGLLNSFTHALRIPLNLATLLIAAFVPILLRQLSYYLSAWYSAVVQYRAITRLRVSAFESIVNADMTFLGAHNAGDLVSVLTGQVDSAGSALLQALRLISISALVVIYSVALLYISPMLTGIAIAAVFVMSLVAQVIVNRSRQVGIQLSMAVRGAYSSFVERIGILRLVKMLGQEDAETRAAADLSDALKSANVEIVRAQALVEVIVDPGLMLGAFFAIFIGIQYLDLSLASLSLFIFVLLRMNQKAKEFSGARQQLSAYLESLLFVNRTTAEAREERDVVSGPLTFHGPDHAISFNNVAFSYDPSDPSGPPVLRCIDLVIPAGTTTAIVGRSGAGKSTLVELIPRLRDVTGGEVLIDGVNIREFDLRSLRRQIGYMTQEAMLINDTVYSNLVYGLEREPSSDELQRALEDSFAAKFVDDMPEGLESLIGDRGVRLSGGERQRLGLARVLLQNPRILILDEPTSALDSESENAIQLALERVRGTKTILVVAHRLSTVQKADRILVIDDGRIAESGTHHQLLEADGIYRRLFESQLI